MHCIINYIIFIKIVHLCVNKLCNQRGILKNSSSGGDDYIKIYIYINKLRENIRAWLTKIEYIFC